MTQPTIYSPDEPGGRPATDDDEIAAVLGQYTAADGSTDFHALWLQAQAADRKDLAWATAAANEACRAFIDSGNATYAQRSELADTFRTALNRLRELNGGHLPTLTALED